MPKYQNQTRVLRRFALSIIAEQFSYLCNLRFSVAPQKRDFRVSFLLLSTLQHNGAALTTLIAEMFMFVYEYIYAKKYLNLRFDVRFIVSILFGCFGIAVSVIIIDYLVSWFWLSIALKVILSAIIYFAIIFFFKNEVAMDMLQRIKQFMHVNRK